ncbi:hypothetical protein EVAR_16045_1 [Eumeta japonica]|uniref:Uncharacterized protein n=1 Tax=Eumeta variegata TaxID=151549 RepID=A0A4C1VXC2_EUMVA|nr:hypothetical protein EVAR_16045_1 [Eumeta japonica]
MSESIGLRHFLWDKEAAAGPTSSIRLTHGRAARRRRLISQIHYCVRGDENVAPAANPASYTTKFRFDVQFLLLAIAS